MEETVKSMSNVRLSDYRYKRIQIETYSLCNMKCNFCPYPLRLDKGVRLESEYVYEIIDSICPDDKELEYVSFHQFNEPLVDTRIYDFIKYAENKKLPVLLVTNALLLGNPNIRENLIAANPSCIRLSIQTVTSEKHERFRGTTVSFDSYKAGIRCFLREVEQSRCSPKIVIDVACNFHSTVDYVKKLIGIRRGDPSVVDKLSDLRKDLLPFLRDLFPEEKPFKRVDLNELSKVFAKLTSNYNSDPEIPLGSNISFKIKPFIYGRRITDAYPLHQMVPCASNFLGILADGSVVPCCLIYDKNLDKKLIFGNIKEKPLKTILNDNLQKIEDIRKGVFNSLICRKCQGATSKRGAMLKNVKNSLYRFLGLHQKYAVPKSSSGKPIDSKE